MANSTASVKLPDWPTAMSGELAAAYIDVSPRAFRALVASGEITGRKIGPKSIRYLRRELDEYVQRLPKGKGTGPRFD